jgi:hypothetical protein
VRCRAWLGPGRRDAGPRHVDLQHCLHERRLRQVRRTVRALPRKQFVQQHAQRVHVTRGADGLSADLLGRGVVRCQRLPGVQRQLSGLGLPVDQQLGNPEIQQVHLALFVDQHIGGLEVTVDHQVRMGVLHRVEHLLEQRDAFA